MLLVKEQLGRDRGNVTCSLKVYYEKTDEVLSLSQALLASWPAVQVAGMEVNVALGFYWLIRKASQLLHSSGNDFIFIWYNIR